MPQQYGCTNGLSLTLSWHQGFLHSSASAVAGVVVAAVTGVAVTAGAGFEGLGKVRELKDWEEELLLVDFFFFS